MLKTLAAVCLSLLLVFTGCTTMRPVPLSGSPGDLRSQLKPGQLVRIHATHGNAATLRITEVGETAFKGRVLQTSAQGAGLRDPNLTLDFRYEDITAIEIRRFSVAKTSVLVLGGVAGLMVLGLAALASSGCCPGSQ